MLLGIAGTDTQKRICPGSNTDFTSIKIVAVHGRDTMNGLRHNRHHVINETNVVGRVPAYLECCTIHSKDHTPYRSVK